MLAVLGLNTTFQAVDVEVRLPDETFRGVVAREVLLESCGADDDPATWVAAAQQHGAEIERRLTEQARFSGRRPVVLYVRSA